LAVFNTIYWSFGSTTACGTNALYLIRNNCRIYNVHHSGTYCQLVQRCPAYLAYSASLFVWNVTLDAGRQRWDVIAERRNTSDWPDCPCDMSELCTFVYTRSSHCK